MKVQLLIVTPRGTIYGKTEEASQEEYNQLVEQMENVTLSISKGTLELFKLENNSGNIRIIPLQLLKHSYIEIIKINK
jgi:hypothetical protein